jgi:uncharacterized coiled-coil DUF342 family protein
MAIQQEQEIEAGLQVRNIGGINETSVEFSPGVTVLEGRNATNRTSLLRSLIAVLGSDRVTIKGDAEEAHAKLEIGEQTYTRSLERQGGTVATEGESFLDDPELAELFAFLLESNEARRAVGRNGDLRDVIMRPVDTDEIESEIDRLVEERDALEAELEEIDELKEELPALEEKRTGLLDEIDEQRTELAEIEEEIEATDRDVEETREEKNEFEEKLDELQSSRGRLEDLRYDIETESESLERLKSERQDLEADLESLPDEPAGEVDELTSEIEALRTRKRSLETDVNDLMSVVEFNEEMLEEGTVAGVEAIGDADDSELTAELLPDDEVACWTCGTTVETESIEATLSGLREVRSEKLREVRSIDDEIDELTDRQRELEERQRERDRLERRLGELESEIEETVETIDRLEDEREAARETVEELEAAVDDLEVDDHGDVLELHKAANQLEYEIGRLESDLESVEAEIESIESRLDEQDAIEARRSEIAEEISAKRTEIDRLESDAIDLFNEHMETVLDLLEYDNLDRIWLENVEREVREGRRTVSKPAFELHVVRRSDSGVVYEDTVDNLSESEREVTGLVFALAGYLAHELHEDVPFMLLDSLEAIDTDRIEAIVEHFAGYAEYLVVALLPEDASGLSDSYRYVTEI